MRKKSFVKILSGIIVFILLFTAFILLFVEPWIEKKIQNAISNINSDYVITIEKTDVVFLPPGVAWEGISIKSKSKYGLDAKIQSIKFKGVDLIKFLFKNDLDIRKVVVSESGVKGKFSFEKVKHVISSLNINVDEIFFDKLNVAVGNASNKESWLMKEGAIRFYNFKLLKKDTLLFRKAGPFDLKAEQLIRISPDSFYTFKVD